MRLIVGLRIRLGAEEFVVRSPTEASRTMRLAAIGVDCDGGDEDRGKGRRQ
jgi:hypothetical protein